MTSWFARRDVPQPAGSLRQQLLRAVLQPDLVLAARYTVPAPATAVATAITFAPRHLGKPCQCGAARPDAYDCSRLAFAAYAAGHAPRPPA
jgi:hypothetical protein